MMTGDIKAVEGALIAVEFWLVWSVNWYANVVCLLLVQFGQMGTDVIKMGEGNLFVKLK